MKFIFTCRNKSVSKKVLRLVDRIAQSKYFQQAAELKYIKRAMEEVSNTRLMLTVELRSMLGTLSINVPPPPTDRLWYVHNVPLTDILWYVNHPLLVLRQIDYSRFN